MDTCIFCLSPLGLHWQNTADRVVYERQKFLSRVSGSLGSRCLHGWVRAVFRTTDFSLYPHTGVGVRELCVGGVFCKAPVPFTRTLQSWPNYIPKARLLVLPLHWPFQFSIRIWLRGAQTLRWEHIHLYTQLYLPVNYICDHIRFWNHSDWPHMLPWTLRVCFDASVRNPQYASLSNG